VTDGVGGGRMIALLGVTGTIGTHVARGAAEMGLPARAVVRDPTRLPVDIPAAKGDLREPASLRAAFQDASRLLLLTPHGPDQDLLEAAAIDAAVAAGVERIVKISGSAPSLGPNGPTPTAVAHWRSEQRIEDSGIGFRFLRPSFLLQNLLRSAAPLVSRIGVLAAPMGRAPIAMVDARDVAECAIAALVRDDLADGAWDLTGPRPVSYPGLAAALGVPYVDVPRRVAARALRRQGASAWEAEHALLMAGFYATGAAAATTPAVEELTGKPPRSPHDFIAEHAAAFGGSAADRRATPLARMLALRPLPRGA
jgi:uncharacterized protein YbjT (DUF2867 family)